MSPPTVPSMRALVLAIAAAVLSVFFAGELVGFRPVSGEVRTSTVAGVFTASPVAPDRAFAERHGLGDGEPNEVLCERRASFEVGEHRLVTSPDGHLIVCRFTITTTHVGAQDPSSHPYAYFFRDPRWTLATGKGLHSTSGPARKLIRWPLYWVGNGLILAALLLAIRVVRAALLKGARPSERHGRPALAVSLSAVWIVSGSALFLWALAGEHPASSQVHFHAQPEVLLGSLLVAPLLEELVFRGLVQEIFREALGAWAAIIAAATAFALAHDATPGALVSLFLSGVLFGWIRHRTGSLMLAIAAHGLTNVVIVGVQLVSAAEA